MPIITSLIDSPPVYGGRSPHRHAGRFYNHPAEPDRPFFWRSLYMYLATHAQRRAAVRARPPQPARYEADDRDHVTWIGHSSFLVKINGLNVLVDPLFDDLTRFMPRLAPNGILFEDLPPIDVVLISHNHRDHMDARTLYRLYERTQALFLVPHGDETWFIRRGMGSRVRSFMWWDRVVYGGVEFLFTPAWHWSQRGIFDRNKSLWGGWYMTAPELKLFYAGDTAYACHFKEIRDLCGAPDVALLPIGPCEPRAWMKSSHLDAEDAGRAFIDLQAQLFIPMHWGTYGFGLDSVMLPVQRLRGWWKKHRTVTRERCLRVLSAGQSLVLAHERVLMEQLQRRVTRPLGVLRNFADRV